MASNIDPTKPTAGAATTNSVRQNFAYAKAEIEAVQAVGAAAAAAAAAAQAAADAAAALNTATLSVLTAVRNASGAPMTKGQVVYINGAVGQMPTVALAIASGEPTSSTTLGMLASDLADNTNGYAHLSGSLLGLDTSAFAEGAALWLSPTVAGGMTTAKPASPNHLVYLGVVEYAHAVAGKVNIKIKNGFELEELHNVSITTPADGETIQYDAATSLWKNAAAASGAPSFPNWAPTNGQTETAGWSSFKAALDVLVARHRADTFASGAKVTPTGTYAGSNAFYGAVLLPDGRVFCVPYNSTTARIYDPQTDTLITPTGAYPGLNAFNGGVLLPDGRVFCVPLSTTTARIYNPMTDTVSTPTGTYPPTNAFVGGVLLPDGRVFCVPYNTTTARIYNPVTDTLITPTGAYPGSGAFGGGVLLPDGRVFCVPYISTTARIYDPVTDTVTTPTGTYPGGGAFIGGVLLPDGRVFCVPHSSTTARIYDPATDTLTTPAGTYPGSNAFVGGALLPDGRVFCTPYMSTTARIYDPVTDTLITPPGAYPGVSGYAGCAMLPDGRVFCAPFNATVGAIAATGWERLPKSWVLSPYFNNL